MTTVIVCAPIRTLVDTVAEGLGKRFPALRIVRATTRDEVTRAIGECEDCEVLITFGSMMSAEIFARAKRLRWVQGFGTGVDGIIDQPTLGRDVIVTATRGIHGPPVSEMVMSMMLALARDLPRSLRQQAAHAWQAYPTRTLAGKCVGIVGTGDIARRLARKCAAFDMSVSGFSRTPRAIEAFDRVLDYRDLASQAATLDFLVLLAPYTEATHEIVNAKVIAALRPSAYIVNAGRGRMIDEEALIEALAARRIAGAGLDVFRTEPLPATSALWDLPNVIVTPHMGGMYDGYAADAFAVHLHNAEAFFGGTPEAMRFVIPRG